jgi:hypothetical protein
MVTKQTCLLRSSIRNIPQNKYCQSLNQSA